MLFIFGDSFCIVLSENEIFPTTFEQLIDMVADKGDAFEDKLRSRKNEVHSSLW